LFAAHACGAHCRACRRAHRYCPGIIFPYRFDMQYCLLPCATLCSAQDGRDPAIRAAAFGVIPAASALRGLDAGSGGPNVERPNGRAGWSRCAASGWLRFDLGKAFCLRAAWEPSMLWTVLLVPVLLRRCCLSAGSCTEPSGVPPSLSTGSYLTIEERGLFLRQRPACRL